MKYDLELRTLNFGKNICALCRIINRDPLMRPVASQLIRSATSIGANYCEANGASSRRDFRNKIHICKKEAQETKYWLRLLENNILVAQDVLAEMLAENEELIKIFATIAVKCK